MNDIKQYRIQGLIKRVNIYTPFLSRDRYLKPTAIIKARYTHQASRYSVEKLPCRLGEEALSNAKGMENDVRTSKSPMIIENCATLVILSEDSVSARLLPSKPAAGISGTPVKHSGKPGMDHTRLYLPFGWFSTTHASCQEEDAIVSLAKDRALAVM